MDPSGQKLGSEFNPDIPGNPESGAEPGDGRSCRLGTCTVAVSVVLVILIAAFVAVAVLVLKAEPQFMACCPDGWIGYQGKCYYFSEAEENWNNSQRRCSALGASLALIDSEQDLALMMRYKGVSEHWIGLWREQEGQRWKWVNGSDLNSSLQSLESCRPDAFGESRGSRRLKERGDTWSGAVRLTPVS
ncbi:unnamed protein product [Caretta caretta]